MTQKVQNGGQQRSSTRAAFAGDGCAICSAAGVFKLLLMLMYGDICGDPMTVQISCTWHGAIALAIQLM